MVKALHVQKLTKSFSMRQTSSSVGGALKRLFSAKVCQVNAIEEISFSIARGERVAFIGPNGAGKSTTIKMLTGILLPSSGRLEVLGLVPWKERHKLGYQIGCVFGQRSQLWYHLPPRDTFELLAKIYELKDSEYKSHLSELVEGFEIGHLLDKPVRSLSLGERMRCEIVASLLHKPKILFLDEPTIGLDINAKLKIRTLLNDLSKNFGTTLFLTSHDTADIEQVCDRVIVLDKGKMILDNSLAELKRKYVVKKRVTLITEMEKLPLDLAGIKVIENDNYNFVCELDTCEVDVGKLVNEALKITVLKDMMIDDPSMDEIIRQVYANG
ncbi:MAG: ATP-binding cassette domain-containing protein [Rhabdochlamydiaceae bacterium]|nr:ATP-binding cassette domain-containing protein [Candidatus Amphrikana amoebophyrae]